ncbi:MAG: hypothetical protein ACRDAX_00960 [Propionibacteriaceae bacterium]
MKEKTKQEISKIERSMPHLPQLTKKIESAEKELEKFKNENNVKDLEKQRDESDKNDMEAKACELEKEVDALDSISKLTKDIEQKENESVKDKSDLERIKNKRSTTLKQLFPSKKIESNFKNTVQVFRDSLVTEFKAIDAEMQAAKMSANRFQTERDHLRSQTKSK